MISREEAIETLTELRNTFREDFNVGTINSLDMAIEDMQKQIPKKVEIPKWASAICPSCGIELSTHEGDGYYAHPIFLKVCPNEDCCQRLDWSE